MSTEVVRGSGFEARRESLCEDLDWNVVEIVVAGGKDEKNPVESGDRPESGGRVVGDTRIAWPSDPPPPPPPPPPP